MRWYLQMFCECQMLHGRRDGEAKTYPARTVAWMETVAMAWSTAVMNAMVLADVL